MITMITAGNYLEKRPQFARVVREPTYSPAFSALPRSPGPDLILSDRARRHFPLGRSAALTPLAISEEPAFLTSLPLEFNQLMGSLAKSDPNLDQGCQILTIGLDICSLYQKLTTPGMAPTGQQVFCLVDVLLGLLELFSWAPGINRISDQLTIVHFVWKQGGKIYQRVAKASDPEAKPLMKFLRSKGNPAN